MKAPLILGNDLRKMVADTLAVLSYSPAISINQDALGIQARRVAVQYPANLSLSGPDVLAVVAKCDPSRSTQTWFFANVANASAPPGGLLQTIDNTSETKWCMSPSIPTWGYWGEGIWRAEVCPSVPDSSLLFFAQGPGGAGVKNYTMNSANLTGSGSLKGFGWSNQLGASGPWPHARYVADRDTQVQTLNSNVFLLDLSAASDPSKGSRIQAADTTGILDDDLVGNVAKGGTFCQDLVPGGMLEVWAGPLTGGRIAVAGDCDCAMGKHWGS